ncbi:MAG: methyl-accepting chemotaxis protein [Lachnospiraceae bacterium]|nr:methyl-accepting chemotaxis protein [Ruminococcus sp.]MCM1275253.1 methyl-accepting chemotaxis protein [Lachnospiraceae bacterium]
MNSKIGRKLLLAIIVAIVATVVIVNVVTIHQASNANDSLMQMHTASGMNTLVAAKESQLTRIANLLDDMDLVGLTKPGTSGNEIEAYWNIKRGTASDFAAFFGPDGSVYWQSENYSLSDFTVSGVGSLGYSGVVSDSNGGLSLQTAKPTEDGGAIVAGMYLTETSWIDTVKEQISTEITIIGGTTRIATTIINNGNRATGTEISAKVAEVLKGGDVYEGTADVVGQKHFVYYRPMFDINQKVVGAYFAGYSSEESYSLKTQLIVISTVVAVVVAVASMVAIGAIAVNVIVKPIQAAEALADSMSRGALSEEMKSAKFGKDELGEFVKKLDFTRHELSSYIKDINNVLSEMAKGDFTVRSKVKYLGDFVQIGESIEQIETSLRDIIGSIGSASRDVKNGSEQIAEGSQVLADGTTRQAAAIEQLSASINEIADKVQQSARNAEEASKVSVESAEKISYQNNEVKNMLVAMDEIKEKSDQIQNIIKAIDDIAFQTNILALNAAIEAARAGAAGKGFAVVADEVRNLAQKSAESAAQTGDLINATIAAVNKGTVIAQSTAETMKEVTELSDRTNQYIGEISTAADDQAESIEQVKTGIDQISTVVQQNSATAEQTAASCEELSGQSAALEEQIHKLKVQ